MKKLYSTAIVKHDDSLAPKSIGLKARLKDAAGALALVLFLLSAYGLCEYLEGTINV